MTTTKTIQEDKLLTAARLLDEDELNALLNFVNEFVEKKEKKIAKQKFIEFLEELREKTAARGLTPEILEEILAEND